MAFALSVSASAAAAKVGAHRAHGLKASSRKTSAVVFSAKRGRHLVRADAVAGTERNGDADASVSISAAPSAATNGAALVTSGAVPSKEAALARARDIMAADPAEATSLALVGQMVDMKVCFSLHYVTKPGEDLYIIGSDSRLGNWDQNQGVAMTWTEGNVWQCEMELPAGGVFFYKYLVKLPGNGFKWQDGANNLLVLPEPWDAPEGGVFMADDDFGGVTREAQTQLAVKLISTEKEKVQLRVEANKAKEMTKAALQELLLARDELNKAQEKIAAYEGNVQMEFNGQFNGGANQR